MVHVGVQEDRKDIFGGVVIGAGKEFSEDFEAAPEGSASFFGATRCVASRSKSARPETRHATHDDR